MSGNQDSSSGAGYLTPPRVDRGRYERNFIKTAVCELRFPTVLSLESTAPAEFQAKLRKLYPAFERQVVEQLSGAESVAKEVRYVFRARDKRWIVTLRSSSIALETTGYLDFEDFLSRFRVVLESARELIDSDFFLRVGLRYINWIPISDGNPAGWVRESLLAPLDVSVLGPPQKYTSLIRGTLKEGTFTFRQALRQAGEDDDTGSTSCMTFVLDVDYADENVEVERLEQLVRSFNETNFYFFEWAIGDKARSVLGKFARR